MRENTWKCRIEAALRRFVQNTITLIGGCISIVGAGGLAFQGILFLKSGDWTKISISGNNGIINWNMHSEFIGLNNIINELFNFLNPFVLLLFLGYALIMYADDAWG